MPSEPRRIESESLLLVEGKDECNFFKSLFEKINIRNVEIHDVGGKDNFGNRIKAFIKIQGFSNVIKLGFIRDAEDKPARDAFTGICSTLKNNQQPRRKRRGMLFS